MTPSRKQPTPAPTDAQRRADQVAQELRAAVISGQKEAADKHHRLQRLLGKIGYRVGQVVALLVGGAAIALSLALFILALYGLRVAWDLLVG